MCFFIATHLAHKSLDHKLKARRAESKKEKNITATTTNNNNTNDTTTTKTSPKTQHTTTMMMNGHASHPQSTPSNSAHTSATVSASASPAEHKTTTPSTPSTNNFEYLSDVKSPYDYAFTIGMMINYKNDDDDRLVTDCALLSNYHLVIGCFDLFHHGHVNLMNTMKKAVRI